MTGRLRYVLVAAFVALFALFPEADQSRIAFLKTKTWLTDAIGEAYKPAKDASEAPALPPLQVARLSIDGADDAQRDALRDEFIRSYREWARGESRSIDASQPPVVLALRVGEKGFRSELAGGRIEAPLLLELFSEPVEGATPTPGIYYPNRWSLAPAFLAIAIAILIGKVVPALLLGCLVGAWLYAGSISAAAVHFADKTLYENVLSDQFKIEIIGFVLFLFMTVGVMTRCGGIQGMVNLVSKFARGPVSAQLSSWIIGVLIFFDDYSNCIITGSTMRPLTDRYRVSREKLAYIVDSTAAPIAGVSIFSTWVAYEVSMFAPQLPEVFKPDGTAYQQSDGFGVFVQTLPVRFYCIFTLIMVLMTILTRREFGGMRRAQSRALRDGTPIADDAHPLVSESLTKIEPPDGAPLRARNALIPIVLLVVATIALIFTFGYSALEPSQLELPWIERVSAILGNGESQRALCFAAAGAFVVATALALGQKILTFGEAMSASIRSARALLFAVVILLLAWSIGSICGDVGTAQFLTAAFHDSFTPWLLPALMFGLAALVAFSTGTSYGTMSILLPNVVVLAYTLGQADPELGTAGGTALMILTIGAVLEGSIFGDHCSPISDTTVLSSVATGSDHMHHVRTQAPYAVLVMIVSMVCGYLPCAWFGPDIWPIAWAAGGATLLAFLLIVGRHPDREAPHREAQAAQSS